MLIENPRIGAILKETYYSKLWKVNPQELFLPYSPLNNNSIGIRPCSASVEDCSFGDSGKGSVVQKLNNLMTKEIYSRTLYSYRYNGSRNAGHEIKFGNEKIAFHQLPVASIQEGAVAIMGKGMLIHPEDLCTEIKYVESKIKGYLPSTLLIDENAIVTTNLHSAFETFTNNKLDVGHGATGSGVAQGYATLYEKRALTIKDLISEDWKEKFASQYKYYSDLMGGDEVLSSTIVNLLTEEGNRNKKPVGTINEFLDSLEEARKNLRGYVAKDVRYIVEDVWKHSYSPFTFEGAQGGALDPYYGVYPDITASRPIGQIGIPDSTEGVVHHDQIAMTLSVIKIPYMSSVGARVHPYSMSEEVARMYRKENDETGRSTGRDRGIYPIDLVAMSAIRDAARYKYLAVTHLDSNHQDIPIEIITHYTNKITGEVEQYRPYQWHWDQVEGHVEKLPSWDGKAVANARSVSELPPNCLKFLSFLSRVLAPVAIATNGPELGQQISFF